MATDDDLAEGFLQHNQLTREFGTHGLTQYELLARKRFLWHKFMAELLLI